MSSLKHPVYPENFLSDRGIRIVPSWNYVLIGKLPDSRLSMTAGGLHVPDKAGRRALVRTTFGQVIAVGPKVKELLPGDVVHFGEYSGMDARWESHFDVGDDGSIISDPAYMPQDRQFVIVSEDECDIVFKFEQDEPICELRDV